MLTIAYYFLQVILCSCLLMGYYLLVLRNKRFHQYNRFYLLTVAVVSWIVPLIKISWTHSVVKQDPRVLQLLSAVADSNTLLENRIITRQEFHWSAYTIATGIYFLVAGILLMSMFLAFYRIYRLLRQNSCKNIEDVYLILTKANGTPFSFFRYIFWNEEIDLRSESGKQILQHEITHVRQKHSIDKIFIQVMLIPGWFNPFFWLLKREMEMIHEFMADKKAVNNGDTASLAQMLLTAAYPQQKFAMTNPFFFSPIRRRLAMLTNNTNPRFSYMRRAIVLPLLAIVVILFSFRSKEKREHLTLSVASVMENVISVVNVPRSDIPQNMSVVSGESDKAQKIQLLNHKIIADTLITKEKSSGRPIVLKINDTALIQQLKPLTVEARPLIILDGSRIDFAAMEGIDMGNVAEVKVIKNGAMELYGEDARNGLIVITTKNYASKIRNNTYPPKLPSDTGFWLTGSNIKAVGTKPLLVLNGVRMGKSWQLDSLDKNTIKLVNVLKDGKAIEKYGEEAGNGVIEITTTPHITPEVTVVGRRLFQGYPISVVNKRKTETPGIPGGLPAKQDSIRIK